MDLMFQLCRILVVCFAAEVLAWLIPLPIPASQAGIMTALLAPVAIHMIF